MSPQSPFDELAERYEAWYDTKGKTAFETELAALRPLLPALPKPWLEVGCGSGRFAQALGIPLGIDPSVALLAKAKERGIEVLHGEGEKMPFRAASFGTVFLLTTWEFLTEPARVLAECRRILRPCGRLVNGYLDRDGKWAASYVEKAKAGHPLFTHARFWTLPEVAKVTREAGFRIVRVVSTLFVGPGEPLVVEEPRSGYVRGASFIVMVATTRLSEIEESRRM